MRDVTVATRLKSETYLKFPTRICAPGVTIIAHDPWELKPAALTHEVGTDLVSGDLRQDRTCPVF